VTRVDTVLADQVRQRARHRCEYCLMPQEGHQLTFPIDHIIAQQHRGETTLENLALSCVRCNSHKGPNLTGIDPDTDQLTRLFHPRTDRWQDHFQLVGPVITGRTAIGRTTVELLTINDPAYIALRESLIEEDLFHGQA